MSNTYKLCADMFYKSLSNMINANNGAIDARIKLLINSMSYRSDECIRTPSDHASELAKRIAIGLSFLGCKKDYVLPEHELTAMIAAMRASGMAACVLSESVKRLPKELHARFSNDSLIQLAQAISEHSHTSLTEIAELYVKDDVNVISDLDSTPSDLKEYVQQLLTPEPEPETKTESVEETTRYTDTDDYVYTDDDYCNNRSEYDDYSEDDLAYHEDYNDNDDALVYDYDSYDDNDYVYDDNTDEDDVYIDYADDDDKAFADNAHDHTEPSNSQDERLDEMGVKTPVPTAGVIVQKQTPQRREYNA